MGRLGRHICTVHSISDKTSQEGIKYTKAKEHLSSYCLIYMLWIFVSNRILRDWCVECSLKKKVFPAIFCFSKTVKAIDACLGQLRWSKIKHSKIKVKPFSNFARDRCSAAHEKLPWEQGRFGLKWPASLFSTVGPKYFWKAYLKS